MTQKLKIEELLSDFAVVNPDLTEVLRNLRRLIHTMSSELEEEIKYGGVVFLKQQELLMGLFLRSKFVTMEFGAGNEFVDEEGLLEGTGKFRRNLKFETLADIDKKRARYFIEQAVRS